MLCLGFIFVSLGFMKLRSRIGFQQEVSVFTVKNEQRLPLDCVYIPPQQVGRSAKHCRKVGWTRTEEMYTLLTLLGSLNISCGSSQQSLDHRGLKQQSRSMIPSVFLHAARRPEGELFVQGGDTGDSAGLVVLAGDDLMTDTSARHETLSNSKRVTR